MTLRSDNTIPASVATSAKDKAHESGRYPAARSSVKITGELRERLSLQNRAQGGVTALEFFRNIGGKLMSTSYSGGCSCGAIRYEIAAEPLMAGHCQCRDCQRESGTGHTSSIAFPAPAVKLEGTATHWETAADSGNIVTRAFCPKCGSPVYARNSGMPDVFIVRAASLDDPTRYAPQTVVWTASGFAWDHLDPALPRFAKSPAMDQSR